jgi:hypothetical protein
VLDLDALGLMARELLRERAPDLIAETCAWSVGLSDRPHYELKDGRVGPSGLTMGTRAETGQPLGTEIAGRLDLGDARPGSFQDALNAQGPDGALYAEKLHDELLSVFVVDTGATALQQLRERDPEQWEELLEEVGEDGTDLPAMVRALEWDELLRTDAEDLVLGALGDVPLLEVEREGVPLSVVRAAERLTHDAVAPEPPGQDEPDEGVMFLASAAIDRAGLPRPVPPEEAGRLLETLLAEGLEPEELRQALPHLPVLADTAERVGDLLDREG